MQTAGTKLGPMAPTSTKEQPEYLTAAEAMQLLRVGRSAFYRAVEAGDIPSIRVGKLIRIPRAALEPQGHDQEEAATA